MFAGATWGTAAGEETGSDRPRGCPWGRRRGRRRGRRDPAFDALGRFDTSVGNAALFDYGTVSWRRPQTIERTFDDLFARQTSRGNLLGSRWRSEPCSRVMSALMTASREPDDSVPGPRKEASSRSAWRGLEPLHRHPFCAWSGGAFLGLVSSRCKAVRSYDMDMAYGAEQHKATSPLTEVDRLTFGLRVSSTGRGVRGPRSWMAVSRACRTRYCASMRRLWSQRMSFVEGIDDPGSGDERA